MEPTHIAEKCDVVLLLFEIVARFWITYEFTIGPWTPHQILYTSHLRMLNLPLRAWISGEVDTGILIII